MNGVLGHLCHIYCMTGDSPQDGDMNEMTVPSRHRIQNSSPGGLRASTQPLGHDSSPQNWNFTSERRRNILYLWNFNHCTRAPALLAIYSLTTRRCRDDELTLIQRRNNAMCPVGRQHGIARVSYVTIPWMTHILHCTLRVLAVRLSMLTAYLFIFIYTPSDY